VQGDCIIKEGQNGDKFYMISEGTAIATKTLTAGAEPQKVMDYQKGMYFGERALLTNEARAANIIATSDVVCVSLERSTFSRVLGPLEVILKRDMDKYNKFT
jgi:cAMP-dependent protein kinase regulator